MKASKGYRLCNTIMYYANQEKLTYAIRSQETGYPCGGDNKQA